MTAPDFAAEAAELRRKLGHCECDYCEGFTTMDEGAHCVSMSDIRTALAAAYARGASDEREAISDKLNSYTNDNWTLDQINQMIRERGK